MSGHGGIESAFVFKRIVMVVLTPRWVSSIVASSYDDRNKFRPLPVTYLAIFGPVEA
jgi:hypothetical protein